ncbi:MAG: NAD-glutamate dehydrogenase, partial [Colwellia sp.]
MSDTKLTQYINTHYDEADKDAFDKFSQQLFDCSLNDDIQALTMLQRYQITLPLWKTFSSRVDTKDKVIIENILTEGATDKGSVIHIITDDKAFLVDSISELIHSLGYKVKVFLHPVLQKQVLNSTIDGSVLYFELNTKLNSAAIESLTGKIYQLLLDIQAVTSDWPAMLEQIDAVVCADNITTENYDLNSFLHWLGQKNFVFLGHYIFPLAQGNENNVKQSGLGILREGDGQLASHNAELKTINKELTSFMADDAPLLVSKSNLKSSIHRHDYYDQINVKQFSAQGKVVAIHRFIGLFTQVANKLNPNKVPYLKFKLSEVLQRLSLKVDGHNYRKFTHILASLPKRELYESSVEQLLVLAKGIYNLNTKSQSGTFIRENNFNQQVSVLVFVSKDAFCTDLRDDIEGELTAAFKGKILSRRSMLNDDYLAQWHFIVEKDSSSATLMPVSEIISRIEIKTQSWNESLTSLVHQQWPMEQAIVFEKKYNNAFSKSYQEHFSPKQAISAIKGLESLNTDNAHQFQIYRSAQSTSELTLNIFTLEQNIALSNSIPILEQFGFRPVDEFSFKVSCSYSDTSSKVYSYTLEYPNEDADIDTLKINLEQALAQVWQGNIENDGYNKLLLSANINIRQIVIIRAYGKYLRQLGLGYSEEYFQQALINYPSIVHGLINLFESRFALTAIDISERKVTTDEIKAELFQALAVVEKIDHDRILRNFIAAISATVRTNFYQLSAIGEPKTYCSFKIRSREIDDAPQPRPFVETFVYSPRVEGVHLRFGLVSRGGLRWSDRREDFRTEVLGLVKAQQVKNVVIVPQGAKGGFVPKQLPITGSREVITTEAIACYKIFISALLDLTDNNTPEGIIKPKNIICFDGDDSYLVVAADKGTATFSDIANGLADDYGFWLGDAFASGGSVGYDHKKMGITAKGAWVSVQRHFREMGIDVQKDEIIAIGIGDMSGDVFGNGMLSSKAIKLVAAFDHRDIFIDPTPDAPLSYDER